MSDSYTTPTWNSDTLLLALINVGCYAWAYWTSEQNVSTLWSALSMGVALVTVVPSIRELRARRTRRAAAIGLLVSGCLFWFVGTAPCVAPCK